MGGGLILVISGSGRRHIGNRQGQGVDGETEAREVAIFFVHGKARQVEEISTAVDDARMLPEGGDEPSVLGDFLHREAGLAIGIGEKQRGAAQFGDKAPIGALDFMAVARRAGVGHVQVSLGLGCQ